MIYEPANLKDTRSVPIRVLHIVGGMNRAGAETMLMNLYRAIDRNRIQFDFVSFTNARCDYDDEIEKLGGRIVHIGSANPISRFFRIWWLLRRGKWRIVHSHTLLSSGLHLLAAKIARVPRRVAHSHNTSNGNRSRLHARIYQNCMRWMLSWLPTDYVACGVAASNYLFPSRLGVRIIPNAIDVNRFMDASGVQCRQALGLSLDSLVILQVGRLMPVKNHVWSVQIAMALRQAGVNFKMLFVGDGPEGQALIDLVRQNQLENEVGMLGMREDIPELMAAADVMLMPSLHEGFPVVLVESQAAGLPAVISSAISSEVDLSLGLVNFIDLQASAREWAAQILAAAHAITVTREAKQSRLEANGFSAQAGAQRLTSIYLAL